MYKIYINETPLLLGTEKLLDSLSANGLNLTLKYRKSPKQVLQIVDMMEKTDRFEQVVLFDDDVKQLWKDFKSRFKIIKAAGGVVFNEKGEILVMFRRGNWDLPKGKIDPGETKKQAAVREVEEETGIQNIELKKKITRTLHTYRIKKKRILKYSYWYKMKAPNQSLTPQVEEDIERCEWVKPEDFLKNYHPMYGNIREVVLATING